MSCGTPLAVAMRTASRATSSACRRSIAASVFRRAVAAPSRIAHSSPIDAPETSRSPLPRTAVTMQVRRSPPIGSAVSATPAATGATIRWISTAMRPSAAASYPATRAECRWSQGHAQSRRRRPRCGHAEHRLEHAGIRPLRAVLGDTARANRKRPSRRGSPPPRRSGDCARQVASRPLQRSARRRRELGRPRPSARRGWRPCPRPRAASAIRTSRSDRAARIGHRAFSSRVAAIAAFRNQSMSSTTSSTEEPR